MQVRHVGLLVLLAANWGVSWPAMRTAAPAIGAVGVGWSRLIFAVAALALWAVWRDRDALRPRGLRRFLMLGTFNAAVPFVLTPLALLNLPASYGSVLNAGTPIFSAIFAFLLLGDAIPRDRLLGMAGGIVGVALVVGLSPIPLDKVTLLSIGAIMTGSLCYALTAVWTRKRFRGESGPRVAIWQQVVAFGLLTPVLPFFNPGQPEPLDLRWEVALAILVLGVICTGYGNLLYFHLIQTVGPTQTLSVTILIPIFGIAWSSLLLGETIAVGSLVGAAVVLASVWFVLGRPNPFAPPPVAP
jgi:drug/metabolite transporter (DMT)-like permease